VERRRAELFNKGRNLWGGLVKGWLYSRLGGPKGLLETFPILALKIIGISQVESGLTPRGFQLKFPFHVHYWLS